MARAAKLFSIKCLHFLFYPIIFPAPRRPATHSVSTTAMKPSFIQAKPNALWPCHGSAADGLRDRRNLRAMAH